MQRLLDEIYDIVLADRREAAEKYKRGEAFNVFNVLNLRTCEVRTHSAFLKELLDPQGSHGMGDEFLKLFLSSIDLFSGWAFNTSEAEVNVEESVGSITEDCTEGGRIDITIHSSNKVIIIENKIYAGDQENQLKRYDNYGRKFEDHKLLYLTLTGREASEFSCGKMVDTEDYFAISYKNHILGWLEQCMEICKDKALVYNSIKQYSNLLKELTGQMENEENEDKITELLTSKENALKAAVILDRKDRLYDEFVEKFVTKELKKWAEENGLGYKEDEGDCWYQLYPKGWKHHCIAIQDYKNREKYFYVGIQKLSGRQHKQIKLSIFEAGTNKDWPFGWNDCTDIFTTIEKIASGEALKYITDSIGSILDELDRCKNTLQELNIEL